MKQAANPPISEITRPISGMKRARTRVTTNHTSVCRILLLCSRRTHTSTCSPWKRSQSPSMTALEEREITAESSDEMERKLYVESNTRLSLKSLGLCKSALHNANAMKTIGLCNSSFFAAWVRRSCLFVWKGGFVCSFVHEVNHRYWLTEKQYAEHGYQKCLLPATEV